jgi:raffinose/stachyose/melibiose transport system permease protein
MRSLKSVKRWIIPYLFLLPAFAYISLFSYYAIGKAVFNSFMDIRFGSVGHFVGLQNYVKALTDDVFLTSFRNQIVISIMTVFNSVFWPLLAAEMLSFIKNRHLYGFIRTGFVIPMMVPSIVTILMWKFLFNPHFGFNSILKTIGFEKYIHNWLNDSTTALFCVILIGFPFISGMYFLIFHTGLNSMGDDIIDAAIIDGATAYQIVWYIHLPSMKPYIKTVFTLSLISSLSGFGNVFATTGGGPGYATMIPALQMYKVAFGDGNFGYASACGVLLMVVIIFVTLTSRRLFGKDNA